MPAHPMLSIRRAWTLALIALSVPGCSEMRNDTGMISQRIGEIVRTPGAREVDLRSLPTFGWDSVYVSRPGATREEVCQLIGAGRNVCGRIIRIEKAPDDHVYLLFGLGRQLTHVELHALANGRFEVDFPKNGLARERAVFAVRHSTSGTGVDTVRLEPK